MPKVTKLPEFNEKDSEEYWGKEDHPGGISLEKESLRTKKDLKILSKGGGGTAEDFARLDKQEERENHIDEITDNNDASTYNPQNKI